MVQLNKFYSINTNHLSARDYVFGFQYLDYNNQLVKELISLTNFDAHSQGKIFIDVVSIDDNGVLKLSGKNY